MRPLSLSALVLTTPGGPDVAANMAARWEELPACETLTWSASGCMTLGLDIAYELLRESWAGLISSSGASCGCLAEDAAELLAAEASDTPAAGCG